MPPPSRSFSILATEFSSKCAECHGADGKGTGPRSADMKKKPANLTILAKRNNGVFAADAVYKLIDGRDTKTSHSGSEMPLWGCRHLGPLAPSPTVVRKWFFSTHHARLKKVKKPTADPLKSFEDLSCDPEPVIQERIQAIVAYLRQIQEK